MKTKIAIMILAAAALACGQPPADSKPPSAKPGKPSIPAGAVQVDAYTYRYTDAKGKIWIYHQTPFGIGKYEDPDSAKTPAAASQAGVKLPAGAQRIDDLTYRYQDAQGKAWIYRQTPFGFNRAEESALAKTAVAKTAEVPDANPVKVRDLGDSYEFVKNTPFGPSRWTRKKSELGQDERDMVNQSHAAAKPGQNDKTASGKQEIR
jgi:hypothetical protein